MKLATVLLIVTILWLVGCDSGPTDDKAPPLTPAYSSDKIRSLDHRLYTFQLRQLVSRDGRITGQVQWTVIERGKVPWTSIKTKRNHARFQFEVHRRGIVQMFRHIVFRCRIRTSQTLHCDIDSEDGNINAKQVHFTSS